MATETTALVRVESLTAAEIFKSGAIDPILEQIKAEARAEAAKLDISTEANRKAIASLAYKVARSKTFIDGQRKSLVEAEKKRLREIDREGARIWDELEALQKEVRKPLTEWEEADKRRIDAHEALLKETEAAGSFTAQAWQTLSVESMRDRMAEINALSARDWQEFRAKAERIIAEACAAIESAIAQRERYDAEQAELARLRKEAQERAQKEREECIAREAREAAERKAQEEAARKEREAEAERQRIERERKVAEIEREQREANKRHRAKIEHEAVTALMREPGLSNLGEAQAIIAAIAAGKVPHVRIEY